MIRKTLLLFSLLGFISAFNNSVNAQQKLMYYWHFNYVNTGLTAADSPANFGPLYSNYASNGDTSTGRIYYTTIPGTSSLYATYWDVTTGDTVNAQLGAPAGNCLRLRNPSDSMQLLFYVPSTHYQNINFKYEVQKSSAAKGANVDSFFYSTDSAVTWKNSGLSVTWDSVPISGLWTNPCYTVQITDPLANNNSKLVFKIKFAAVSSVSTGVVTGTGGNNRIDNVTFEGDTLSTTPVTLTSFDGAIVNNSVSLTWTAENEINLQNYHIQKSSDGIHYNTIGSQPAKNTGSAAYSFTDNSPLSLTVYYRLQIMNSDGGITYSPVIVINNKTISTTKLSVFPNPANDQVTINHPASMNAKLLITDIQGRKIEILSLNPGSTTNKLSVNELGKGQYILKYVDNGFTSITVLTKE